MKRCIWLTLLAMGFCCVGWAQQGPGSPDSTTSGDTTTSGGKSVSFIHFDAATREAGKVSLQWDVEGAEDGDFFIIERSSEGAQFETIGVLRTTATHHYELTDGAPPNGNDAYRIRYTGQIRETTYSKTIQLSLSGNVDFKFYPNPVDKVFILRTEHAVDMQVIDASGIIRVSKRLQPGIQVVDVSFLERGVYILRVADKESNRAVSSQLVKN